MINDGHGFKLQLQRAIELADNLRWNITPSIDIAKCRDGIWIRLNGGEVIDRHRMEILFSRSIDVILMRYSLYGV